jgi:hypothetical protein
VRLDKTDLATERLNQHVTVKSQLHWSGFIHGPRAHGPER